MGPENSQEISALVEEAIALQQTKVNDLAHRIVPTATQEDLLNPHDIDSLKENMHFNYEDGYLNGLLSLRMAILALDK
jgi:hypothetical protein